MDMPTAMLIRQILGALSLLDASVAQSARCIRYSQGGYGS
jgi:hypothetical protein